MNDPIEIFRFKTPEVINVSYTATAGNSAAISSTSRTGIYRVVCTTDAYVAIGNGVTATTNNGAFFSAGIPDYIRIAEGERLSAIRVSADGSLNITPLSK